MGLHAEYGLRDFLRGALHFEIIPSKYLNLTLGGNIVVGMLRDCVPQKIAQRLVGQLGHHILPPLKKPAFGCGLIERKLCAFVMHETRHINRLNVAQ